MPRPVAALLAALAALIAWIAPADAQVRRTTGPAAAQSAALIGLERQIIVRFRDGTRGSERAQARRSARVGHRRSMRTGAQVVLADRGVDVDRAIAALNRHPHVLWAARNERVQAAAMPDDFRFDELWGLHNTGQNIEGIFGAADADINAPEAWDRQTGSAGVVVAVVDEGVAYDHPDLDGNLWTNDAEANGAAGVDDDGNGIPDDIKGADFIDFDTDPRDFSGHGTHVAGTIAAEGNNGIGVAGVVWDARIMPVRALGYGGGSYEAIANSFDYAGDMGADVVNASLSGGGTASNALPLLEAVNAHPDTLYVVAAGNDGASNDTSQRWPCNLPTANLICVAATTNTDGLASFSNFSTTHVDLGAPGQAILSALAERTGPLGSDTFGANIANWTSSGFIWHSDGGNGAATDSSGAGAYGNNVNETLRLTAPLNLSAQKGCTLHMSLWANVEPPYMSNGEVVIPDGLYVETSRDGVTWNQVALFYGDWIGAGNSYVEIDQIDLQLDGAPVGRLRFRFESNASNPDPYDGVWINSVHYTCTGAYGNDTSYEFLNGTSMATPQVAGAAALLLSERPGLTVAQLRGALLTTGRELAVLDTKTVTGRRLDADGALELVETFPEVATGDASGIAQTVASLAGTVNPVGTPTSYRFEYGTTDAYGSVTPSASAGSGTSPVAVSAALSGLAAATTYHYRLVATAGGEDYFGPDRTFSTLPVPAATPTPGPVTPVPTPTPPALKPPTPVQPTIDPVARMTRSFKVTCRRKGSRRTCKVTATGAKRVSIVIKKGRRTLAKASGAPGKNLRLKGRLTKGRRYRLTITLTHANGKKAVVRRSVKL